MGGHIIVIGLSLNGREIMPQVKNSRMQKNPRITVVVPVYNEEKVIASFIEALLGVLKALTRAFDVIVVDDGSHDQTATLVSSFCQQHSITLLSFSRNFGKEKAISCGLDHAEGDAVIIVDADFQHPLSMLETFIAKWQEGYDNVYGIRSRDDQTWLHRFFARNFYRLNRFLMDIDLPADAGDFRLLDRQVVTAIRALPESNRFMKGLYAWVGFKGIGVPYQVSSRQAGKSRFSFFSLLGLAITGMTSFSDWPLRIWSIIGLIVSFAAILYGGYVVIETLVLGISVSGWATLVTGMMFLGGVQLISIGVLAEYIARIFKEVKHRPNYIVANTVQVSKKKPLNK